MDASDLIMQDQAERRWFNDLVQARFGERLAETRWILGNHLQFTVFEPTDAAELADLAHAEGVAAWVAVLVAEPGDLAAWEGLRHEIVRLRGVDPKVLSSYPTPSPGYRRPPVEIHLTAHAEETARALHERFGSFVALTVGFLTYPSLEPARRNRRVETPVRYADDLRVEVDQPVQVRSGHTIRSELRLTNLASTRMTVGTNGHLTAFIVDADGKVVGTYAGGQRLPLIRFTVEPGETVPIPVLIGTASLDPALGFAVPPGTWNVIAPLWDLDGDRICTPPVPIIVTE